MTADDEIPTQAVIKFMAMHKPGLKDSNFNCLKQKFAIIQYCAENSKCSMLVFYFLNQILLRLELSFSVRTTQNKQ